MTDMNETLDATEELEPTMDELTVLKARADQLGISYHHKVGLDKLRKLVDQAINGEPEDEPEESTAQVQNAGQARMKLRDDMLALVRCNVHCNDPAKKEWPGEIIAVANSFVEAKKYVKFDTTDGYHIPRIIYEALKDKEIQLFRTIRATNGIDVKESYLAKAYAIEVLPPLTEKELKQLASDQRSRHAID